MRRMRTAILVVALVALNASFSHGGGDGEENFSKDIEAAVVVPASYSLGGGGGEEAVEENETAIVVSVPSNYSLVGGNSSSKVFTEETRAELASVPANHSRDEGVEDATTAKETEAAAIAPANHSQEDGDYTRNVSVVFVELTDHEHDGNGDGDENVIASVETSLTMELAPLHVAMHHRLFDTAGEAIPVGDWAEGGGDNGDSAKRRQRRSTRPEIVMGALIQAVGSALARTSSEAVLPYSLGEGWGRVNNKDSGDKKTVGGERKRLNRRLSSASTTQTIDAEGRATRAETEYSHTQLGEGSDPPSSLYVLTPDEDKSCLVPSSQEFSIELGGGDDNALRWYDMMIHLNLTIPPHAAAFLNGYDDEEDLTWIIRSDVSSAIVSSMWDGTLLESIHDAMGVEDRVVVVVAEDVRTGERSSSGTIAAVSVLFHGEDEAMTAEKASHESANTFTINPLSPIRLIGVVLSIMGIMSAVYLFRQGRRQFERRIEEAEQKKISRDANNLSTESVSDHDNDRRDLEDFLNTLDNLLSVEFIVVQGEHIDIESNSGDDLTEEDDRRHSEITKQSIDGDDSENNFGSSGSGWEENSHVPIQCRVVAKVLSREELGYNDENSLRKGGYERTVEIPTDAGVKNTEGIPIFPPTHPGIVIPRCGNEASHMRGTNECTVEIPNKIFGRVMNDPTPPPSCVGVVYGSTFKENLECIDKKNLREGLKRTTEVLSNSPLELINSHLEENQSHLMTSSMLDDRLTTQTSTIHAEVEDCASCVGYPLWGQPHKDQTGSGVHPVSVFPKFQCIFKWWINSEESRSSEI